MPIDLKSELTFKNAFFFPLQNQIAKKEVVWGGLLLLIPVIGWVLNMGHRIVFVHNMQLGRDAWPAWTNYQVLFKCGFITLLGMIFYYLPGAVLFCVGWNFEEPIILSAGIVLIVLATIAIPGFMSHYCRNFDPAEIFNPLIALNRVFEGGRLYWKAWAIALSALLLSFLGLFVIGVGFLFTSVWFWQVAGYSFANVFSNRFDLVQ